MGDGILYTLESFQNIQLNKNPTIIIPPPTMAIKMRISGIFSTLRKMIISDNERAITDIIDASEVPRAAPFSINTETIGTIPAALEYSGMPINTDNGTAYQTSFPISEAINSAGT